MNEINKLLATNMKKARKLLGFSQLKLAELCNLSPSYVGAIETGKKFPSAETFAKIANALKLKPNQLLTEKGSPVWNKTQLLSEVRDELKQRVLNEIDSIINHRLRK